MLGKTVAVVTGAASGIGSECAKQLALAGHRVYIIDRNREKAEEFARELQQNGADVTAMTADVGRSSEVNGAIDGILRSEQRIDIMVNNAGIVKQKLCENTSDEEWAEVIGVNLSSVFYTSRAVLPAMRKQRSGRIISISSLLSTVPRPNNIPYATSKGGIDAFTRSLALEVAGDGITVNAVAPGHILTPLTEPMFTPAIESALHSRIPVGYLGKPEFIADAVLFLSGEKARYITGQVILVDGGYNINGNLPNIAFGGQLDD